jgi:hypothetical protein
MQFLSTVILEYNKGRYVSSQYRQRSLAFASAIKIGYGKSNICVFIIKDLLQMLNTSTNSIAHCC